MNHALDKAKVDQKENETKRKEEDQKENETKKKGDDTSVGDDNFETEGDKFDILNGRFTDIKDKFEKKNFDEAKELLENFKNEAIKYFGKTGLVLNLHEYCEKTKKQKFRTEVWRSKLKTK